VGKKRGEKRKRSETSQLIGKASRRWARRRGREDCQSKEGKGEKNGRGITACSPLKKYRHQEIEKGQFRRKEAPRRRGNGNNWETTCNFAGIAGKTDKRKRKKGTGGEPKTNWPIKKDEKKRNGGEEKKKKKKEKKKKKKKKKEEIKK